MREIFTFGAKIICERIKSEYFYMIEFDYELKKKLTDYNFDKVACCCSIKNDIAYCIITNNYPYVFLSRSLVDELGFVQITSDSVENVNKKIIALCQKYENIKELEKIEKVKKEILETKQILRITLDQLGLRGETLNNILKKTEELSDKSKAFLDNSKKFNKCCWLF